MKKVALGIIIAVATLSLFNKVEFLGTQCYYVGNLSPRSACIPPAVVYIGYAVAAFLLIWGITDLIKSRTPSR
jgi:hypothetical protein